MRKTFRVLALCLLTLSLSGPLFAQALTTIPAQYPSLYSGVRPLGMGNAFIAVPGSDENAPFYNPAAINDYEKKTHARILSPVFDFSVSSIGLVKDVINLANDINNATPNTNGRKLEIFRTFVDAHTGQFESVAMRMPIVQVQHKYFFVSTLFDSRNTISFRNRAFTNIELQSRSDAGGLLGTAYNFKDLLGISQNLQAGVNVKLLYRLNVEKTITGADIVNNASFGDALPLNRSFGVGFDLGLKGDLPTFGVGALDYLKPTAGFTWQDIGNTRFQGAVPDTQQSISLGFALNPVLAEKWEVHFANDFRELNQSVAFIKKWNVGAEVFAPKWGVFRPSVRAGASQGYMAGGLSLDFKYAKLEFSTYGEEVGQIGREKGLRRIATNLSFGF